MVADILTMGPCQIIHLFYLTYLICSVTSSDGLVVVIQSKYLGVRQQM